MTGRGVERYFKCSRGDVFAVPDGAPDPSRCPTCGSTSTFTPLQKVAIRD